MQGSCLCGDIAYEVTQLAGPIVHCHCQTCRKAHAAPFASTARVERDAFRWVRGEQLVSNYESSPGKRRYFCPRCGTQLVAARETQAHLILRMGSLDDDPGVRPEYHIWREHDVPWLDSEAEMQSYPQFPS
ncbi:GFA family protein [Andreprevotia chitinilytica]|uniref:GFA family protein n=1 Tax=Andreprevotia chitinilytica TaxID=396808 RepID=UPI0005527523|nr:GFA family protein [Andreprevotia chitinilytica]